MAYTDHPHAEKGHVPAPVVDLALQRWRRAGMRHAIPMSGISMLPFLKAGDVALVAHGAGTPRRGDVIVFRQCGQLIVHRVLRVLKGPNGPVLLTKGDNTMICDEPVSATDLVGRVEAFERGGVRYSLETWPTCAVGWLIAVTELAAIRALDRGRRLNRRLGLRRILPAWARRFILDGAVALPAVVARVVRATAQRVEQ
jgi:signal peptidase I